MSDISYSVCDSKGVKNNNRNYYKIGEIYFIEL
jgi:hypothetical protein